MPRVECILLIAALWLVATPAWAAPGFAKGPYLMDAQPRSIAVMFELPQPAGAVVTVRGGASGEVRVESTASAFHEVVVDGLEPGTAYDYTVRVRGGPSAEGSFPTAPEPGDGPIEFLVMGDNRTDAAAHQAVIRAMLEHPGDFVLNTGDMVADGSDERDWIDMFDVQEPLLRNTPMFPALGNHELYAEGRGLQSFLEYTRVPRELGGQETYYGFTYGPVRFFVLDSNEGWARDSTQWRWLEEQLEAAEADGAIDHVMVAMHHGPYSSGRHGGHRGMGDAGLADLLRAHGVSLVLSGHDHLYERGDVDGLKYIVTGGGGAPLYPINERLPGQLAFEPTYHFLRVGVEGERVVVTAIRPDGSEIERCAFVAASPWQCEGAPPDQPAAGPVQASENPAAFWAAQYLDRPLTWGLVLLVLVGAFVLVVRRRGRTVTPRQEQRQRRR